MSLTTAYAFESEQYASPKDILVAPIIAGGGIVVSYDFLSNKTFRAAVLTVLPVFLSSMFLAPSLAHLNHNLRLNFTASATGKVLCTPQEKRQIQSR